MCARFLFASTGGALYGDPRRRPTPETAPPAPISPYGASKAAAELYVHTMGESGAMPLHHSSVGQRVRAGAGTRAPRGSTTGSRTEIAGEADAEFVGLKFAGRVQDMVHDGFLYRTGIRAGWAQAVAETITNRRSRRDDAGPRPRRSTDSPAHS